MLEHGKQTGLLRFCIIPFFYNAIGYMPGKYNYEASVPVPTPPLRIMLFAMTLAAYFLLPDMFKSTRENELLQGERELLSLQLKSARLGVTLSVDARLPAALSISDTERWGGLYSFAAEKGVFTLRIAQ